jgi:RNA-directed DNA polymerase
MFNLGGLDDLAHRLSINIDFLHEVLDDFDGSPASLVTELELWPGDATKKPRQVIAIRKRWRKIQRLIYVKLLLPQFLPSSCSHGGVKKRSPATNARAHIGNVFAFQADISNFFPSIKSGRVARLFLRHACAPKVANALTRLCTYDYHLALGLVTSPIIANEILRPIDREIRQFCRQKGLVYTRFIDDITVSGPYDPRKCNISGVIEKVMARHHFKIAQHKSKYGRLDVAPVRQRCGEGYEQLAITGVRLKGNHLDPSRKFTAELDRIIADHASLAEDGPFVGPLYLQNEVFGRAFFAFSLNPGRRRSVLGRLRAIDWHKVREHAVARELRRRKDRLVPRGSERPDCSEELPEVVSKRRFAEYCKTHPHDPSDAPF